MTNYQPWVDGALSGGSGVQDDVLMTILLWKIDAGDYEGVLDIAVYALANRLVIPGVNRTTGTVIAEEIADSAMRAYAVKSPVSLATLERTRALTDDEDMPDEVRAKLYKILGLVLRDNNRPQESYCVLSRALELNMNIGVKTELKQLDKVLKAQRDAEKHSDTTSGRHGKSNLLSFVHRPPILRFSYGLCFCQPCTTKKTKPLKTMVFSLIFKLVIFNCKLASMVR
ncbi:hypothetical protein IC611_02765 [Proteus mirabilis]